MRKIVFGIRKSALARAQLDMFIANMARNNTGIEYDIKTMVTAGDKNRSNNAVNIGQGIFVKELERALLTKEIDCAVHSLKDMPAKIERGTVLSCFVERQDVRDCLLVREGRSSDNLKGLRSGTGSPRRNAFLKEIEPEVNIMPIRGNVDTRIKKMDAGDFDAIVLAACGLKRLGFENRISKYFDPDTFIPAAGQGVIAGQTRADDKELNEFLRECSDKDTEKAAIAERKVLEALGIGCQKPFGVYARIIGDDFIITAKMYKEANHTYIYERRQVSRDKMDKAVGEVIDVMRKRMRDGG